MPNGTGITIKGKNYLTNVGVVFPPLFYFQFDAIDHNDYAYRGYLTQEILTGGASVFFEQGKSIWAKGAVLRPTTNTPLNSPFVYLVYLYCPYAGMPFSWGY